MDLNARVGCRNIFTRLIPPDYILDIIIIITVDGAYFLNVS